MAPPPSLAARCSLPRRRLAPARARRAGAPARRVLLADRDGRLRRDLRACSPLSAGGYRPSQLARAEIPPGYLQLYVAAGRRYGIDPWILAGIGSVETDHGRSTAPGVRSGVNTFGCCAGPMQFSVVGSPSTWDRYGVDGNHDGRTSVYDPADAIPAAARYLRACGAPDDYHAALFAYNHAEWYVAEVLAKAAEYRGAAVGRRARPQLDPRVGTRRAAQPADHAHADPARGPALRRDRPAARRHAGVDRAATTRSSSPR